MLTKIEMLKLVTELQQVNLKKKSIVNEFNSNENKKADYIAQKLELEKKIRDLDMENVGLSNHLKECNTRLSAIIDNF